jgi:hypothetical protein
MTKLWYNYPKVLFDNPYQFFPSNNLSEIEKANSLVRLAIYYSFIIVITKRNQKYLTVSIILILISIFIGKTEHFITDKNEEKCYQPTDNNPFMNFTIDDYYKNPDRPQNCPIDEVRQDMKEKFQKRIIPDTNDLWGQSTGDRNFYTMPSTRIINDQTKFANWLYGSMGECKSTGFGCLKTTNNRKGTSMIR